MIGKFKTILEMVIKILIKEMVTELAPIMILKIEIGMMVEMEETQTLQIEQVKEIQEIEEMVEIQETEEMVEIVDMVMEITEMEKIEETIAIMNVKMNQDTKS